MIDQTIPPFLLLSFLVAALYKWWISVLKQSAYLLSKRNLP